MGGGDRNAHRATLGVRALQFPRVDAMTEPDNDTTPEPDPMTEGSDVQIAHATDEPPTEAQAEAAEQAADEVPESVPDAYQAARDDAD